MKKKLFFISFLFISHLSFGQLEQRGADIDGAALGDQSGWSVSISDDGSTIAIGAPYNDGNGNDSGHVRIYSYDGASWVQQGGDLNGQFADDQSGYTISLSGDASTVAIGAPANDNSGDNSGHVRVYSFDGANWIQRGLDLNGEDAGDQSGWSISLSDNGMRIAIGAPTNAGSAVNAGHVRIYEFNGADWVQLGVDIDGPAAGNLYGTAVSLSSDGNRVAVGAPTNGDNGIQSGHIRIYEYNGIDEWVQFGSDINGQAMNSYLGRSVSLSSDGTRLAAGGGPDLLGDGSPAVGYANMYEYAGGIWVQMGATIVGELLGDRSGTSVSMSSDGNTVVIGAPFNDNENGISGHFRLYSYDGAAWTQQGQDVNGEAEPDSSGYAVGLSGDGTTIVVGAPFNNESGFLAGHARVFVNTILSLEDNSFSASLQLYPNPSSSVATITLPDISNVVTVKVYDLQGKLVYQNQYQATDHIILDTRQLTRGLYFVSLTAEGEKGILKMLVD